MVVRICAAVCCLMGGLLGRGVCGTSLAQDASAQADTVPPAAPPVDGRRPFRSEATYGTLQAGRDAYQLAEQQRRGAIDLQLRVLDDVRRYNSWAAAYVPSVVDIYAFGGRRAARRASRYGLAPVFTPWPYVPGHIYGYAYYPRVKQPIGHETIWTGPNSYIYRPRYTPPERPQVPETIPTPPPESGPREF